MKKVDFKYPHPKGLGILKISASYLISYEVEKMAEQWVEFIRQHLPYERKTKGASIEAQKKTWGVEGANWIETFGKAYEEQKGKILDAILEVNQRAMDPHFKESVFYHVTEKIAERKQVINRYKLQMGIYRTHILPQYHNMQNSDGLSMGRGV